MKISAHVPVVHVAVVAVFVVACTLAAAAREASAFLLLRHRSPRSVPPLIIARDDAGGRIRTTASWWLLAYYPNDETLSERLQNVKDEWDNARKDGIGKFLSDEFELAEKLMLGNAQSAVKEANDVMERGGATATVEMSSSSSSGGGDDYLLREGFHAMATAGGRLAGEVRAVRQELDVSRAARGVEGAAEDVVGADVLIERDLARVVDLVVSSLREADEVVQSAIAAVSASRGGLTDKARVDLTDRLEARARGIEESIKEADDAAKIAREIAFEDRDVVSELERTGDRLSDAIDAAESLAGRLGGAEGGSDVDSVSDTAGRTADIVRELERAAEGIADAVGQKVIAEADAVTAMGEKAGDSVGAVRAAGAAVRDSSGPSFSSSGDDGGGGEEGAGEFLRAALARDAEEIRGDADAAERLAEAIRTDATNDEGALEALESASGDVDSLMDAVKGAVDRAANSVLAAGGGDASSSSSGTGESGSGAVAEAVGEIESEIEEVEDSISDVKEAAEKCQECNVKEIAEEIGRKSKVEDADEPEEKGSRTEVEHAMEPEREKDGVRSESKADVKAEAGGESGREAEKDRDTEASSSEAKDPSPEITINGEEEKSVDHYSQGAEGGESMHEASTETIASAGGANDVRHLDNAIEALEKMSEPAKNAVASATDAAAEPAPTMSGHFANDALASTHPLEGYENIVASTASVASKLGSFSESTHDTAAWTPEAVAEAVAIMSSFFL